MKAGAQKEVTDEQINDLIDRGAWITMRRLVEKELKRLDPKKDRWIRHWWVVRLGLTYYEKRDYQTALTHYEEAHKIAPRCPLALWSLGLCLDMLGRDEEALKIYRRIIRRGVDRLAHDQCGEGKRWAKELIKDCQERIKLITEDV